MKYLVVCFVAVSIGVSSSMTRAQPMPGRMPMSAPPAATPADLEQVMNSGPKGTLAVRAVQGTKGGPAVGIADVQIELFHRNQAIKRFDAKLDENGMVLIRDLPVAMPVRAAVRVKFDNVMYQEVGPLMDPSNPNAAVEVTVYQTTDQAPAWHVKERNVMIEPVEGGLHVGESTVVENPSDKTWLGGPPDTQGRRPVVVLTLPEGAQDVHLDAGFHGWCCTSYSGRTLTVQMPLMPGPIAYRYSYRVPAAAGRIAVLVGAPVVCDKLAFSIPDDGTMVSATILEPGPIQTIENTRVRIFHAGNLSASTLAGLTCEVLSGARPVVSALSKPSATSWVGASTPLIVTIGVGLIIFGGAVLIWLRPPGDRAKQSGTPTA